jgi:hypothetical protein
LTNHVGCLLQLKAKLVAYWQSGCLGEEHKQSEVASNAKRTMFEARIMLLEVCSIKNLVDN